MTPEEERAKAVLAELDDIARDVDHYEYGLPLYTDDAMRRMLDVVVAAIRDAVAAEAAERQTAAVITPSGVDSVHT